MPCVCIYFQVHQPIRLRDYSFFDIGVTHDYEDDEQNRKVIRKVAENCYLPANKCMLGLIEEFKGDFRIAFSITGPALDQLEKHCPETVDSFKKLAGTGCVEFLAETYHHTLAFLYSEPEFTAQVEAHRDRIEKTFGCRPTTFRNTELICSNDLIAAAGAMGFDTVLAEGAATVLGKRSPNRVYTGTGGMKLLLRNYRLSDDIGFRFSHEDWAEHPLSAEKYAGWVHKAGAGDDTVNLFLDYETMGEHHWAESGIFGFFESLPGEILKDRDFKFLTPREIASSVAPAGELDMPEFVSWADEKRDLSAWCGSELQEAALDAVYGIENDVIRTGDPALTETWRQLQTSDHFYYMCTKWFADGDVHKYFNPYLSPYDAHVNYMNVLSDFTLELKK